MMTMPVLPDPPSGAPARKGHGSWLTARVRPAAITVGTFGLLITVVQVVNSLAANRLTTDYGIVSRTLPGLVGVVTAPLLHVSWPHLLSNLVPLLICGFLIMLGRARDFVAVTVLVWLMAGLGVWLVGPAHSVTVGASGLVFGWLAYLVTRGVFTRNIGQIAIGLVLVAIWGGVFWTGIVKVAVADISGVVTVSWQGHLFGAIGGVLAALLLAKAGGQRGPRPARPALVQGS